MQAELDKKKRSGEANRSTEPAGALPRRAQVGGRYDSHRPDCIERTSAVRSARRHVPGVPAVRVDRGEGCSVFGSYRTELPAPALGWRSVGPMPFRASGRRAVRVVRRRRRGSEHRLRRCSERPTMGAAGTAIAAALHLATPTQAPGGCSSAWRALFRARREVLGALQSFVNVSNTSGDS